MKLRQQILRRIPQRQRIRYDRHLLILPQDRGLGTYRRDAKGVDLLNLASNPEYYYRITYLCVALRIMTFDMREFRRLLECGNIPVQMPQPSVNMRVPAADISYIGLQDRQRVINIYSKGDLP
jgi:hypothetical protein